MINSSSLIGANVNIIISDPWDFGTIHGVGPFKANILDVDIDKDTGEEKGLLLQIKTPLNYEGVDCEFFVASPRLQTDKIKNLKNGINIGCGLTRISRERAISDNPFDLSWWRGGVGLIASLQKV